MEDNKEEKKPEQEELQKKPIELSDIDYSSDKNVPKISLGKPEKPSLSEEKKVELNQKYQSAKEVEEMKNTSQQQKKPSMFMIATFALGILLCVSIFWNMYLSQKVVDITGKARSNADIAKQMLVEKEKISKERKPLKAKSDKLTRELLVTQNTVDDLKRQNDILKRDLGNTKKRFADTQNELQKYADDVKELASRNISFYNFYEQEKSITKQLKSKSAKLETKITQLNNELNSIDDRYATRAADYIYNMAFLYVKAGMLDKAIESFLEFIKVNGEDAEAHYNLALLYDQAKKDKDSAIRHYTKYLELNPDAEDLYEISMRIESLKRSDKTTFSGSLEKPEIAISTMK